MSKLTGSNSKWRGMTVSSILQIPVIRLLLVIGIAIVVTTLFTGDLTKLKSQREVSAKHGETNGGGK